MKDWIERSAFKTQRAAAVVLSLHPVVLSQILTGVRKPELGNAVRIEQVTGISVESWLLTDVSNDVDCEPVGPKKSKSTKR